jgi:Domain of Unknown Function (DUF1080)
MPTTRAVLGIVCLALLPLGATAAESASEPRTLMTERGKLLFSDDLAQPLGKDWRTAKGKWEVADGAVRGSEIKDEMHGAVTRHMMPFHDVVIQYSFKLDGAKGTSLSVNDPKGHCCRLSINSAGFQVQKDSHDHNMSDKAAVLDRRPTPIKPGEWHAVVVEIRGKEILARLDGEAVAVGEHDSIDVDKSNFGLTVAGESASFKDLRVWQALPNKEWEATKAKLLGERGKSRAGSK